MAIRLRTINTPKYPRGIRVALCANETDAMPGDVYLDDIDHMALTAKFSQDYFGQAIDTEYLDSWQAMDTQKQRDARQELEAWLQNEQVRNHFIHRQFLQAILWVVNRICNRLETMLL